MRILVQTNTELQQKRKEQREIHTFEQAGTEYSIGDCVYLTPGTLHFKTKSTKVPFALYLLSI